MAKPKTWQSKLNKKEMKHLAETCESGMKPTLRSLKNNLEHQNSNPDWVCWDCRLIGRKLGLVD